MAQYNSHQNNSIIMPYLREVYDYGKYEYDSHSVSPDGKYIAMYLIIKVSEDDNNAILKLFKISDDDFDSSLIFCKDLLALTYCDNLSILWSATGNKLICEYQMNSAEPYSLIYFDITTDEYIKYNVFSDETYKWEHSMSFSEDDSMLVTVYNREIIRVFEYSAETRNYHFKTEEEYDSNIYTITNIYLTEDNKLIVALYNSTEEKNVVVSYQINDDKTELQYLTEYSVTTSVGTRIFNLNKCTYDKNDYLLLLVAYGINYHSPSKIYIYDLTELKITEVIDINNQFGGYMGYAYKMLFGTIRNMNNFPGDKDGQNAYLPKLCYQSITKQTNHVNNKYIWVSSGPQGEICKYIFNVFTKEKIFTAYSSHEYNGIQNINGRLSHRYNQLHKTSNKVYVFTNDEQEPYKAMYNLNKFSQLVPIKDINFIHDTQSYVICDYNNKLWYGHSLPFCEEKNIDILTKLLNEYIPIELCHLVAKYCF